MGKELILSEEAEADLEDIWDYIAEDSPENADRLIGEIYRKCLNIKVLDGIGRPRDELADGLFSLPHKKYMIFFLRNDECVSIVRILRASRDIEAQFETE
jgi:plasmid stabilization system protein ParE